MTNWPHPKKLIAQIRKERGKFAFHPKSVIVMTGNSHSATSSRRTPPAYGELPKDLQEAIRVLDERTQHTFFRTRIGERKQQAQAKKLKEQVKELTVVKARVTALELALKTDKKMTESAAKIKPDPNG